MEKCNYRNCDKTLEGRKGKKYCCKKHKDMEKVYIKRRKSFIEKYSQMEKQTIDIIKYIKDIQKQKN